MEHITLYDEATGEVRKTFRATTQDMLDQQQIPDGMAVYKGKVDVGEKINLITKTPEKTTVEKPIVYSEVVEAEINKQMNHVLVSGTPAEICTYIDENITDLNSAKVFLKDVITHFHLMTR